MNTRASRSILDPVKKKPFKGFLTAEYLVIEF